MIQSYYDTNVERKKKKMDVPICENAKCASTTKKRVYSHGD